MYNIARWVSKGKEARFQDCVPKKVYSNAHPSTISECKRIYSEIESNLYSHNDFLLFLIHNLIFEKKLIYLKKITENEIDKVKKLYTLQQFIIDKQFIIEIDERLQFKDINKYFEINVDGGNLIYEELVMKKRISPVTYIKLGKKIELEEEKMNEELKRFVKLTKEIKNILSKKRKSI